MTLACAAALLFAVQPALAEADLESEFAKMKELVEGLQQKVEAQDEQIEHQSEMLEQAQTAVKAQQEQAESLSGLSTFLDAVEVDGHFAGSYNYNFNTPKDAFGGADLNNGVVGALPFHGDHNTMTVDQIWFGIGKPATEESPAGFRFDILYGNNANFLGQGTGGPLSRREDVNDSTSDYYIAQAYAEYTADIGDGLNFKFGKFQTMVGAEVVQATGNFNVTRGIVYSQLQPVDHLGLLGTLDVGPVELGAAVVNAGSSDISSPDINKEKSYIATAALGDDRMSLRTSFIYGAEDAGSNSMRDGLVDVTAWFNPTESVSLWANYNYLYGESTSEYANGIALAGRVGITDKIGAALRGEYIALRGDDFDGDGDNDVAEAYTLTGTADYALTYHLTAKAEVRFDWVHDTKVFFRNGSTGDLSLSDNQTVGLVEVVYEF
jgi:hypothetical protein